MSDLSRRDFLKKGAASGVALTALGSLSNLSAFASSHLPTVGWDAPTPMVDRITADQWVPPEGYEQVAEMIDKPLQVFNMGGMKFDPATAENQEAFYKRTGIKVDPIEVPSPVALPKETTALSSRSPQPVLMQASAELYLGFIEPGWLEPTCELWNDDVFEHFSKSWKNDFQTDVDSTRDVNCVYGTCAIDELQMVHWRKDLLREAGLDPMDYYRPTWDDIMEIGEALEGTDRFVFSVNGQPARYAPQSFIPAVYAQGGSLWEDGNLVFNSDVGVAALEFLVTLVEKGYMPSPGTTDQSDVSQNFLAGKSVGAFHGTKLMAQAYEELNPADYLMALPFKANQGPDPQPANLEFPDMLTINTFAPEERKLAAKIYADFRRSREAQVREFLLETNFPAIDTAFDDPEVASSKYATHADTMKQGIKYAYSGIFPRFNAIADNLGTNLGNAFAGKVSAQEALDKAQNYVDDVLGQ